MWAIPGPIDCELREYNIDLGDRFGDRSVYVKMPMDQGDMKIQELSKICYDIAVDAGYQEETTVTIKIPYSNLGYLSVTNENKEEKKMPIYMNNYDLPDELKKIFGLQVKDLRNKPEWINGLPAVKKVEVYNNRVVKVTFIDGTFTKSICSENDNFDLDVGITICALKRLLGTNSEDATKQYNKFIEHVHAVMKKNNLKAAAEQGRKISEKARRRKMELKQAAKKLKAKEAQIDIQKQAYIRAVREMTEDDLK